MVEENKEPLEEKEEQVQEGTPQSSEETKEEEQPQSSGEGSADSAEEIAPEDLMAMWEDALREAGQAGEATQEAEPQSSEMPKEEKSGGAQTQPAKLEELSPDTTSGPPPELDFILDIPLEVSVEIGRTKMLIKDLLKLNQGSIIELEKFAGEPVEVYVNGKLMAKGEVIVVNDKF